jgi:outer membrane protein assembly factor BamB
MLLGLWLLPAVPPLGAQGAAPTWVEAWKVETESRRGQGSTVTEDCVYVASDSDLLALDAADGSVIWTAKTGEARTLEPIVVGDAVFVANQDGTVTRFRAEDGTSLWQATGLEVAGGPPLVTKDLVYINGGFGPRGYLVAYDTMTGTERWRVDVVVGGILTPKGISGAVYTTAADPETNERIVLALDADTGRELWRTDPQEDLHLFGVGPDQIYASEKLGDLVAFDPDGVEQWRFDPGEQVVWVEGGPSEVDGVLYASTAVGMVGLPSADPAIFALVPVRESCFGRLGLPAGLG